MDFTDLRLFNKALLVMTSAVILLTACGASRSQDTEPAAIPTGVSTLSEASTPAASPVASPTTPSSAVSFTKDILPIFDANCIKCHGGDKTEKGLSVKTYDALMAGSDKGAVVLPRDADGSRLAQLLMNGKMPKRAAKLSPQQIQLVIDWINSGAQNN